jgi:glycogen debranching enzyme
MANILSEQSCKSPEVSSRREWLLTNGIGGFVMGTASGINTRRYHGLLVAATEPPALRMVLLAAIEVFVQTDGTRFGLSANQYSGAIFPQGYQFLHSFSAGETAVWQFRGPGFAINKTLRMHPGENAITIEYANVSDGPAHLTLRPLVCHKFYHSNFYESPGYPQNMAFPTNQTLVEHDGISICIEHPGAERVPVQGWYYRFEHAREFERGLEPRDDLFCPCELNYDLRPGEKRVVVVATTPGVKPHPSVPTEKPFGYRIQPQLEAACAKFVVATEKRTTIIAGYPWFTDWGRDTMISLPGALLKTGRIAEARSILKDFAGQMFQGLIPNRFVEHGDEPAYNTVDGTLWFANAIYLTLQAEWDREFAEAMMHVLQEIFEWHLKGTLFGIGVDPKDGLLTQGQDGVQLTWMDAKVGDWVVTPRHGKPIEINALWINALRATEWLAGQLGFIGVISSSTNITSVSLLYTTTDASTFVDNVAFGSINAVPEPLALITLGLGVVALLRSSRLK